MLFRKTSTGKGKVMSEISAEPISFGEWSTVLAGDDSLAPIS